MCSIKYDPISIKNTNFGNGKHVLGTCVWEFGGVLKKLIFKSGQ